MGDPCTELAILRKSLDDIMRRVEGAPQTPSIQQVASRAVAFRRMIARWETEPPPDDVRSATVKRVLEMHIELMQAGIESDFESASPDSR